MRRTLVAMVLVLLVGVAWSGFRGGMHQLGLSHSLAEWLQTLFQFVYGLAALLTAATAFRTGAVVHWIRIGFAVTTAAAAGLAAVVWGDADTVAGLAAGAGTLLVAAGIVWLLRIAVTPGGSHTRQGTRG